MSIRITRCLVFITVMIAGACAGPGTGTGPGPRRRAPDEFSMLTPPTQLPDTAWGTHALIVARARDDKFWAGTYGRGIFVFRPDSAIWDRIVSGDSTSISWNFVNSFAFPEDSSIWYGTIGNGWGRSADGGKTWKNWTFSTLGPEWQYVIPDGIRARGDTIYIATADGLRVTTDDGETYRCIQATSRVAGGSTAKSVPCAEHVYSLPTEYLLSIDVANNGDIWVGHLSGISMSSDRGTTWRTFTVVEKPPRA